MYSIVTRVKNNLNYLISVGLVLGAFFYGYITTQVPGGWLANRYGGKWVYAIGMLLCNIMTALTPIAARTSYYMLVAARVIEGIGQVQNWNART